MSGIVHAYMQSSGNKKITDTDLDLPLISMEHIFEHIIFAMTSRWVTLSGETHCSG
jgi:hypothetical protein